VPQVRSRFTNLGLSFDFSFFTTLKNRHSERSRGNLSSIFTLKISPGTDTAFPSKLPQIPKPALERRVCPFCHYDDSIQRHAAVFSTTYQRAGTAQDVIMLNVLNSSLYNQNQADGARP
jgi:hypothetical protein